MSRFAPILREVDAKLDLPQPTKSRIILEMAADLDDLFDAYVAGGADEEDAERRVAERFTVTDEMISELAAVHESAARLFLRGLSDRVRSRGERAAFAGLLLFLLVFAGREAASAEFFAGASVFLWPILGLSAVSAALAGAKAYRLWVREDHEPHRLMSGLGVILALGAAELVIGFYGAAAESYLAVGRVLRDGPNALLYVVESLLRVCPMLMASLFTAMLAGILWHVLIGRIERIETARAAVLLGT